MARRSKKKQNGVPAYGTAARREASAKSARGGTGWKGPLGLALLLIGVAGGSIYWQMNGQKPAEQTIDALAKADIPADTAHYVDNTGPEAGYAGSETCAQCHQGIAESFNHIAMGRSLYKPTSDNIIEDYTQKNDFYHEPSDQHFRMTQENGRFYQTRYQNDPAGHPINEKKVEISYVVGSGNHSRSYLHRELDGKLYQLPIAWYSQDKKWGMNPGYDTPNQINFSRRITYDCIFCHAALPDVAAGADQYNYGETSWFPEKLQAIDCERCHGPAAEHVKLARGGAAEAAIRKAIVNPGNLDNKLQLEVCMQCHLETTSGNLPHSVHVVDKGIFGYRPGEPLEKYRYAFDHPKGTGHDDKFEIAGQAYRMRMSECFIKSNGKMTCTTCHDPHKVPQDRVAAGIQSCFECHKPADCTEKMELRLPVKDNCIQCHMPQRRTDDVVNVVMTDHYIQRRPPPADVLLAPKKEHSGDYRGDVVAYYPKEIAPELRNLYMGLAYISNSADLQKGLAHLDSYIKQHPDNFSAVYTKGVGLKMLGELERARTDLEAAVKLKPTHPQAWMALGDLYEMMRDYKRSVDCYRKAGKLNPRISRAHNGEGTSLMLSGDLDNAEAAFRRAVTCDPFDENPHLNLAEIYLRRGDMKPAEAEARAALAINPRLPDGWLALSRSAQSDGRNEEGIWTAMETLGIDPKNAQAFNIMMAACEKAGPGNALKTLAGSADRAPFAAEVATSLLQIEQDNLAAASDSLSSASEVTTAAGALTFAVQAALQANRPELALLWGQQAWQTAPDSEESLLGYASALRAAGQGSEAESRLQEFLQKQRTPRVVNALAWLKATAADAALRNGHEAAQLADEAAGMLESENIFVMQSRAAAAAELGTFDQAAAIAAQALKMAQDANLKSEAGKIEKQLADYKAGRPHRATY